MDDSQRKGRSIGIWGESSTPSGQLQAHFNYWHLGSHKSGGKGTGDFFDIGVRCVADDCPSRLLVYVPLNVELASIEDLGPLFYDKELAAGIFNESLSVTQDPNKRHIMLSRANQRFARVFVFAVHGKSIVPTQLTLTQEAEGTLIEITQAALAEGRTGLNKNDALYFRIRVRLPVVGNPFSRIIKPADGFLLSSIEYTEFLDFRLNEARNLPDVIASQMWKTNAPDYPGTIPVTQVHFLVVVGEAASVAGGVESDKQRLLENQLWERYTKDHNGGESRLCDDMVVHHWKKKPSNGDKDIGAFSAFMKLRIRRSGRSLIVRYLAVVAAIGCMGSLLANGVWVGLEKLIASTPPSPPLTSEAIAKACSQTITQAGGKDNSNGRCGVRRGSGTPGTTTGEKQ